MEPMEKFRWFIEKAGVDFKQHQYDGVEWCVKNEMALDNPCGVRGGFVADEMGLGKTIMMIGVVLANLMPRTLVVLPSVLIDQWMKEVERTTGHKALLYYGPGRKDISMEKLVRAPLVITSYNMVALDKKRAEPMLHQVEWSRIICDEAHHLRNGGKRFKGVKELKAPLRWLVSGTPIQNRLRDFYNLCASLNFPVEFYKNPANREIINRVFMLKRTKAVVGIWMPECKMASDVVPWTSDKEHELSMTIHSSLIGAPVDERLRILMQTRQVCVLPQLLKSSIGDVSGVEYSSKVDALMSVLLARAGNGNGKLVFCHFHLEMDEIARRLREAGYDSVATFDGRTKKRTALLKAGYEFLILQIQTGCEGLNLQADFSEVYFVSPNWNPAIEEQAIARCHRIGQKKEVNVFRFHMEEESLENGSVEERIRRLQEMKREISREILNIPLGKV
jgi:SNF2 family DNA or RNA helicase